MKLNFFLSRDFCLLQVLEQTEHTFSTPAADSTKEGSVTERSIYKLRGFYVRFEAFTAVTMKNGVFLDVTPCGSCKNRLFGGT
jgi:hypothetical protein